MGSHLPFRDLTDTSASSGAVKRPKLEPFDEPFNSDYNTHNFNFSIGSQSSSFLIDSLVNPNPNSPQQGGDDDDVLAEFNRVSDLFRTAFESGRGPSNNAFVDPTYDFSDKNGGVLDKSGGVPDKISGVPDKISGVSDNISGVLDKISGVSDKNVGGPDKIRCVSDKNLGVSDKNLGVADKNLGVADKSSGVSDPNTLAIVPVSEDTQVSCPPPPPSRKQNQRSAELVRVTDLALPEEAYFREIVRQTRMVYDSLRVFAKYEEEKILESGQKRSRADLRAASVMRDRGMWMNRDKRIVGSIPGVKIGDLFLYRMELCVVGLHGQAQAGIDYLPMSMSATGEPIATSIIVSGGYEDDVDSGEEIVYTGHGGQDKSWRQCADQKLEGGNLALERSMKYDIEVRVIRGFKYEGSVSGKVYVYDGLYKIYEYWFDVGKSGFGVYKYKLARIENQPVMGSAVLKYAASLRIENLPIMPSGYVSPDISKKQEKVSVALYNDIDTDHEPLRYDYMAKAVFPPYVYHSGNGSGCNCINGCDLNCHCAIKNGGEFPYDQNGNLVRGKPLIFECGVNCKCPPSCRNRVTQKGVKNRLEVFRSVETSWGVRSLDLIQAGSFICEYAGVVLTREQAQVVSMNGDGLVYPNRFSERWAEWGDLSQIFSDYVKPVYPSIPPLDFAIDISRMRNVACYISHSLSPNVFVQFVLYDHNNLMFPHLMLFAMENIPPLREISLDYGGVGDDSAGKLFICNN